MQYRWYPYPGKSQVQVPAVQIPVKNVPDIGFAKSVLKVKTLIPHDFQIFKMSFHALIVMGLARVARLIEFFGNRGA